MLTTAIIAFREFLEAFLLVGIFVGLDRKLGLGKQKEIISATILGIGISLFLPFVTFNFSKDVSSILTEKNADKLEGYLLTFSGLFLAYVIFSLHSHMKEYQQKSMHDAHTKMRERVFDISLFFTLIFFIFREGFEIALLTTTTSLFSSFAQNMEGLLLGFTAASLVGLSTLFTYISLPIKKVFRYTEYCIVIMGAAMVMNGISILSASYLFIHLEKILPLPLQFLPKDSTILGHVLKNIVGIQREMGIVQILLMALYAASIYLLFLRKKHPIMRDVRLTT